MDYRPKSPSLEIRFFCSFILEEFKMKKIAILIALVLCVSGSVSQAFAASSAAVLPLLISPGARASGMGEAFVAVSDDATATFWNTGGLAFQTGSEITFMHAKWLPQLVSDMSLEFLAYKHHIESLGGTLAGNVTFFNYGVQEGRDEFNNPTGTFHSWDLAVALCYGTKLSSNLGMGVAMRYIRSNLSDRGAGAEKGAGVGSAFAVDLGILYRVAFLKGLSLGMNLSNMGPKITYIDAAQADPLPTNLKIGLAYQVLDNEFNRLQISVDTNKLMVVRNQDGTSDPFYKALATAWSDGSVREQANRLISSCGAEYCYNNMIYLRTGYYYDYEGKVKYPSFGAGLQYAKYRFDFAYIAAEQGHPLSDTMRFSLTAGF
jgi:hypothetical protein